MKNNRFYKAIEEHEKWLFSNKQKGMQLVLKNEDLSFIEIIDRNLSYAIIENCNLQRAVMINTTCNNTIITNSYFSYAVIENCNFNNCFLIHNTFEGTHLKNISFIKSLLSENIFNRNIIDNYIIQKSNLNKNTYKQSHIYNISFTDSFLKKESMQYIKFDHLIMTDSYIHISIKESTFFNSTIKNSYTKVIDNNNIFINTTPEKLFDNNTFLLSNKLHIDEFLKKINTLETKTLDLYINKNIINSKFDKLFIDYKINIMNYLNKLENYKYYLNLFEKQDDKIVIMLKNKLENIEKILFKKLDLLNILEQNKDDENEE